MAQCGKVVCLKSVKNLLSVNNHAAACLSDGDLTANLQAGLQINDPTDGKAKHLVWIDDEGRTCMETFPRELKMGPGTWTYTPIMFKPTSKTPAILIDVAHLEATTNLSVECYSHQNPIKEVLFHFKMDANASGWDLPVNFTLTVPGCGVVLSRFVDMREYIIRPGYHYLSIGKVSTQNIGIGEWVAKMSNPSASCKKGLTIHGILFRSNPVN